MAAGRALIWLIYVYCVAVLGRGLFPNDVQMGVCFALACATGLYFVGGPIDPSLGNRE